MRNKEEITIIGIKKGYSFHQTFPWGISITFHCPLGSSPQPCLSATPSLSPYSIVKSLPSTGKML